MEVLRYISDHFELSVDSYQVAARYTKAARKIRDITSSSSYEVSGVKGALSLWNPGTGSLEPVPAGQPFFPVFYENADYIFDIGFTREVENPRVYSRIREVAEKFNCKKRGDRYTLTGTLNFGNDIGKYDFVLRYELAGVVKEFVLSFEVFPIKLDYKSDYRRIILDIEKEYTNLVLDFLKKTYSNFRSGTEAGNDLIWWSIFGQVYKDLIASSRFILNKPHSRLVTYQAQVRREQVRKLNPYLEEQLVLHKGNPNKLYHTTTKQLTQDTSENRFFKYALLHTYRKFGFIKKYIEQNPRYAVTDEFSTELAAIEKQLRGIANYPFFRSVGEFKGLKQESQVLHKKTGYSSVYKNWILLKRGLEFFEGIQKIDLKDIAELYQVWCFLKMKGMVRAILGKDPEEVNLAQVKVDNFLFALKKGVASQVVFHKDGQKIELYHDYTYGVKNSHENHSYTVEQRPDIVLKITKDDLKENYVFTYLYDAKYRLRSDENEGEADSPTVDSINQMHRYRDAIYYLDKQSQKKGKEVIGGYILFPGAGTIEQVRRQNFFTSIQEVNIGAYPLVPNDAYESQQLLQEHLATVLGNQSQNILQELIPHKGMDYQEPNGLVLAAFIHNDKQKVYLKSPGATIYHMPVYRASGQLNTIRSLDKLKYFAPIIDGIEEYFEIEEVVVLPRNEIFPHDHVLYRPVSNSYYVFRLSHKKKLKKKIQSGAVGGNRVFRYARLSDLKDANSIYQFNKEE